MKIELREITLRELTEGYRDNQEDGVLGYGGRLDIRPPYQREFIYKEPQRDKVIETIRHRYPLNVMYWSVRDDGKYEVIDGQQRTISACQYVAGDFAFQGRYFHNLLADEQQRILDYEVTVYLCTGTDSEKLDWFKTINIAGEKLTDQELRNAVFAGSWVTDAKRYFSKTGCPAARIAGDYLEGSAKRQDYLATAIKWINGGDVEGYMARHQHDPNANELWLYFQRVIAWVAATFPKQRREMKGVPWGQLYNEHGTAARDSAALEAEVARLMADEDVTKKKGIYVYLLDGQERHLSIRAFSPKEKREAYERQAGICPVCQQPFRIEDMQADHVTPWHDGGRTTAENCRMLCADDNRRKGGI